MMGNHSIPYTSRTFLGQNLGELCEAFHICNHDTTLDLSHIRLQRCTSALKLLNVSVVKRTEPGFIAYYIVYQKPRNEG